MPSPFSKLLRMILGGADDVVREIPKSRTGKMLHLRRSYPKVVRTAPGEFRVIPSPNKLSSEFQDMNHEVSNFIEDALKYSSENPRMAGFYHYPTESIPYGAIFHVNPPSRGFTRHENIHGLIGNAIEADMSQGLPPAIRVPADMMRSKYYPVRQAGLLANEMSARSFGEGPKSLYDFMSFFPSRGIKYFDDKDAIANYLHALPYNMASFPIRHPYMTGAAAAGAGSGAALYDAFYGDE